MVVAGSVRGQSPNATVTGEVVDPSGAAIADATVEVINEATNLKYSTRTNREGIYVIPELPPATYRIEVSHVGFKTVLKPDVIFNVRDAVAINFKLPIGAISETVTVEAGASMINTTDASVSTVVDQTYIKNMPLNGRSFQDLILLTPGIVTNSPQQAGGVGQRGEFSVNGQRTEANYYTVDGVSANVGAATGFQMIQGAGPSGSVPAATALGTTQALVSVDALQEFRVQSSTYSAEYGRNPGGQFAFETKSGTNQWHGTAYDYLRNDYFDANDWFSDYFRLKQPPLRQNDFGGTLGAPVRIPGLYNGKDKTFFFVSYEGLRLTLPQPATADFVPDLCMRGVVAQCPSGRQPAANGLLPVMNAFPLPSPNGLQDATNGVGQFIGTWSNPNSIDSTSVRFDHDVNDKVRLFFRFSDTSSSSADRQTGGLIPSMRDNNAYTIRTYTAGISSVISSRLSNEFRINHSSNDSMIDTTITSFGGSTPVNLAQLSGLPPQSSANVGVFFDFFGIAQLQQLGAQRQWNFVNTVSLSLGSHQLKFGVDYRRLTPFGAVASPELSYFSNGGEPSVESNSNSIFMITRAPGYPLYQNFSAFAQDQWRVSPRLRFSLGLRWDVNPPPDVTQGLKPYTIQGSGPSTWTLAPQGAPLWQTAWYNFAPRLGVAYILHDVPGRETVVRSGGGVFFDTGQQLGSFGFSGPGFSAQLCCPSGSFPVDGAGLAPVITNPPTGSNVYVFPSHFQLPYTLQWNSSIEQAMGKEQALTVSYVGSHAARLPRYNLIFTPNSRPQFADIYFIQNGLTSDYDSLQVQFRRRLSRGLTALASHTWSHCLDYGSQNFGNSFGYRRGNCDFDVRHNLSAAFSYDLPNVGHNAFANTVLRHWGFDNRFTVRTAFPVILQGKRLMLSNGQLYNAGVNLVPGQPVYLYGDNCTTTLQSLGDLTPGQGCPGGRALNPQAFTNASSGFGTAPRNFAQGFGAWQMDLAVRREFPIFENLRLQFRADAFNVFNHPNFGTVNPNVGQRTFGQATSTLANSLGTLSPLYQQGGPRSMQFALKIIF